MEKSPVEILQQHGIQPSAQRVAIAEHVLQTDAHPSADAVLAHVRARLPMVSRATVYNTLKLFVDKGLLRQLQLTEGAVVFDPKTEPHHHFIDETTGEIRDIPWDALRVDGLDQLPDDVRVDAYQVVLRGRSGSPPHDGRADPTDPPADPPEGANFAAR